MSTKIAIAGAMGRMGQNLIKSGLKNDKTEIVGVFDIENIDKNFLISVGLQSGIATNREKSFDAADVVIDFTSPKALFNFTEAAVANNTGLVIGTTGLDDQHFKLLQQSGQSVPVFYAPNMSFGVNFFSLARKAAAHLKDFDIEIVETTSSVKKDAPSGTAIKLGEEIADELNFSKEQLILIVNKTNRKERKMKLVFFNAWWEYSWRTPVIFHGDNESIELTHRAFNREIFSDGAIEASIWLSKQKKGYFTFKDLL